MKHTRVVSWWASHVADPKIEPEEEQTEMSADPITIIDETTKPDPTPIRRERDRSAEAKRGKETQRVRRQQRENAERRALQEAMDRWQQTGTRQIVRLPMGKLRIDHDYYQRELDEGFVARIVKTFDATKLGELEVNIRPDGSIYVIDGQHRLTALARIVRNPDLFQVPCILNTVPTVEEETNLYLARNFYIKPATSKTTFQARITMGDERAIAIRDLIEAHGYRPWMSTVRVSVPAGWINTGAAEFVVRQFGLPRLDVTLDILRLVYGDRISFQTKFLTGLATFTHRSGGDPNFRMERLIEVLRRNPPEVILTTGANRRAMHHVSNQIGVALALFDAYNYGIQKKLAKWMV